MREFIVEADGGSRGNPGPAGYGAVVTDAATGQVLAERSEFLGVVTKGPALAVGLGLMWAIVTENLLRGVGSLLGPVETLTKVLPGGSAGNLAGAVGGSGAPGVLTDLSGTTAALFLVGYVVVFLGAATLLKVRRDLV